MDYRAADFYSDLSLVDDPHAYFDYLREQGPVTRLPHRNVVAVTGYDELVQVSLDNEHFSSINAVGGAIPPLPFQPQGDDITSELEAARPSIPFSDMIVCQTGERHAKLRSIIARLFTPSRMKQLEPKLRATADALIDEFAASGRVDLVSQYGRPYATLVIADLLGVSDKDRRRFRELLKDALPAEVGASPEQQIADSPIRRLGKSLFGDLAMRRLLDKGPVKAARRLLYGGTLPPPDILTDLALAKYPDGSIPSLVDVTSLAAFLFGAGQDTTNHLMANSFKLLATRADIQQRLRAEPARIPDFIEEVLRYDGSVKGAGRVCKKTTTLGGVEIKAGTFILLAHMGANRDPRRFADPDRFDMDRPKLKEHMGFGRGAHTCIGAQLARREVAVSIERLLARLGNIRLGPAHLRDEGTPRFDYEPTYILRALKRLDLEFDLLQPVSDCR